jgi:hypothetical protein
MRINFLNAILDNFLLLFVSYRHIKAFYEHYPQDTTDYGVYFSKMSLIHALSNQGANRSKSNDTRNL